MPYWLHAVEDDRCLTLVHTDELSPAELATARAQVQELLDRRGWKRLIIDVTQVHSDPAFGAILGYANDLAAAASRPIRVALVVRPGQERPARIFEKAARHGRVFATYFVDPKKAVAWVKRTLVRGWSGENRASAEGQPRHSEA